MIFPRSKRANAGDALRLASRLDRNEVGKISRHSRHQLYVFSSLEHVEHLEYEHLESIGGYIWNLYIDESCETDKPWFQGVGLYNLRLSPRDDEESAIVVPVELSDQHQLLVVSLRESGLAVHTGRAPAKELELYSMSEKPRHDEELRYKVLNRSEENLQLKISRLGMGELYFRSERAPDVWFRHIRHSECSTVPPNPSLLPDKEIDIHMGVGFGGQTSPLPSGKYRYGTFFQDPVVVASRDEARREKTKLGGSSCEPQCNAEDVPEHIGVFGEFTIDDWPYYHK